MKLKIGDKVKIKDLTWYKKEFLFYVNTDMKKLSNKICTISYTFSVQFGNKIIDIYYLKEDPDQYNWTSEMFDLKYHINNRFLYLQNII